MKKIVLGLALALIAALAVFVYSSTKKSNPLNQATVPNSESTMEDSGAKSVSGTIKDLIAQNVPLQCSFNHQSEAGETTGKVYLSGQNVRGDFTMTQPDGQTLDSFMIRKDDYAYVWGSALPQGTKLKIEDPEDFMASSENDDQSFNLENQDVDYSCKPWLVNSSIFNPPSDIEFVDLSETMQQMQDITKNLETNKCSACDQLPAGDLKDQCLQALDC